MFSSSCHTFTLRQPMHSVEYNMELYDTKRHEPLVKTTCRESEAVEVVGRVGDQVIVRVRDQPRLNHRRKFRQPQTVNEEDKHRSRRSEQAEIEADDEQLARDSRGHNANWTRRVVYRAGYSAIGR